MVKLNYFARLCPCCAPPQLKFVYDNATPLPACEALALGTSDADGSEKSARVPQPPAHATMATIVVIARC
jgi:hypothetical protein